MPRAPLGHARLVRQYRQGPPAAAAGSLEPILTTGCAARRTGTARSPTSARYELSSKKFGLDTSHSVTAIVACYNDNQAIPIMYDRLKKTFAAAQRRPRDHLRQ